MTSKHALIVPVLALAALTACGPTTADTDSIQGEAIAERPVEEGRLVLTGELAHDGAAAVTCASVGHGEHGGLRLELSPGGDPSVVVAVEVHDLHGDGTYEAEIEVQRSDDGVFAASEGHGEATLELGTELARDTATRWVSGEVAGSYQGEAGDGELEATFERCFHFG